MPDRTPIPFALTEAIYPQAKAPKGLRRSLGQRIRGSGWPRTLLERTAQNAELPPASVHGVIYTDGAALPTIRRVADAVGRLGDVDAILCGYDPSYGDDDVPPEGFVIEDPYGGAWRITRERAPRCVPALVRGDLRRRAPTVGQHRADGEIDPDES